MHHGVSAFCLFGPECLAFSLMRRSALGPFDLSKERKKEREVKEGRATPENLPRVSCRALLRCQSKASGIVLLDASSGFGAGGLEYAATRLRAAATSSSGLGT